MNLKRLFLSAVIGVLLVAAASAAEINGSLPLSGISVTQNGADLSVSTQLSALSTIVSSPGAGDYSLVPLLTDFGPHTLDLTNLVGFSISNATWGTFTASSGFVVQQSANFLDVYLLGAFAAGPGMAAAPCGPVCTNASGTSLRFSFNQSGASVSEAITLASPPASVVPEPASMILLGSALLGVGFVVRRRQVAK